jgi:periplasmic divalent cation tolerance protein
VIAEGALGGIQAQTGSRNGKREEPMDDALIEIEVACPNAATAEAIGRACVEARLAACANLLPGMTSVFHWRGGIDSSAECLLRLKSRAALFDRVAALVAERHPYDLPAIVALPVLHATPETAAWLRAETGG